MNSRFLKSFDGSKIAATLGELVRHVNSALRAKFPEEDLIVFRRYEQAQRDHCIRFLSANGPRVFMAHLLEAGDAVVDIP
jgi:hypothetical protein